jgi:dihydrofolate synthase/folylpolyglutamate synthase
MKITSLQSANKILMKYVPLAKTLTGKNLTLDRTMELLKIVGNPHNKLKVIHVAGTSGKTSTSYYISKLLTLTGKKVGLTVSPHVDSITERIQINGTPISEKKFCKYLEEFLGKIKNENPTYFELMIAFAYYVFAKEKVDYAVMETGLGGSQDSTNVSQKEDKVCVITDIGYDHMNILGNTLKEITSQKAGIIWNKNQVIMYKQKPEILNEVEKRTKEFAAKLTLVDYHKEKQFKFFSTLPTFQQRNWTLARKVLEFIVKRDKLKKIGNSELAKSVEIQVPGRMETVIFNGKKIIMDGAHNEQKMKAFVNSLKSRYPTTKFNFLLAKKEGKECEDVIKTLKPIMNNLIITTFETTQDMPIVSMDPNIILGICNKYKVKNVQILPNNKNALKKFTELDGENFVITGSFYLLSQIRKSMNKNG